MATQFETQAAASAAAAYAGRDRIAWGPLLLGGAALISLASIVGQSHDPDQALSFLLLPLWLFLGSAVAGAVAGYCSVRIMELFAEGAGNALAIQSAIDQTRTEELRTKLSSEEWGLITATLLGLVNLPATENKPDRASSEREYRRAQDAVMAKLNDFGRRRRSLVRTMRWAGGTGVALLVLGFVAISFEHALGFAMARHPESATPANAPSSTPPNPSISILLPPGALLEIRGSGQPATTTAAIQPAAQAVAAPIAHRGAR